MKPTLQGGASFRTSMNGEVVWTESTGYTGTTSGGKTFGIYDSESPSPMEMVLHGHAACSLIDVIDGLKHRKQNLEFIKVEIEADRADESGIHIRKNEVHRERRGTGGIGEEAD